MVLSWSSLYWEAIEAADIDPLHWTEASVGALDRFGPLAHPRSRWPYVRR
jgi:hypothetical protein